MERLEPGRTSVVFHSKSGPLTVTRVGTGYVLDLSGAPFREDVGAAWVCRSSRWRRAGGSVRQRFQLHGRARNAGVVRDLAPDMGAVARLDRPGVIVTAAGDGSYDCVSRYFAPAKGIPEDPVTGAAHCMLAPYWAAWLGKSQLRAYQASKRGGEPYLSRGWRARGA